MPTTTSTTTRWRHRAGALVLATGVVVALAGCSAGGSAGDGDPGSSDGSVTIGAASNGAGTETTVTVTEDEALHDSLPAAVKESGELVIGVGALPAGFPPLAFTGDDQKTLTGSEPDLGRLVAAKLGLQPKVENATWDNMFVGIDGGKYDAAFSNITVTEQRKEKYDFASYRRDELALQVLRGSDLTFEGDPSVLAGKTIAVSSGTNQEKILLEWKSQLQAAGEDVTVKYYPDGNAVELALDSGKIDGYFGPNPTIAYQNTQSAGSAHPSDTAGTYSGAGSTLQGLIAATTKKGSGLAEPIRGAIDELIEDGTYAKWLQAYNLSNEAVEQSEVNPEGLPLDNS
ncbi:MULTISPECIES: transporter substrate-binding domain-containing protein [unclassified Curtobacterium]|uniref:transporter substrate-binding domain-containing protein n=1 Tax=unclassified Curtobacterium TaxID=257496 RepID=UPI0008DE4422|nr:MULTISPECIES: transporter substrate-binding domain-containing protein [unclassified Curtobacterium]OIH97084.1 ABC transporter substrate-binding protein [Curtobacterium sp. MCBA15_003]OII15065.1 ABC transporter substrate-binding protein [Curtobacterium sp. MCBA15_009]OII32946.1 ABC transporter substrate-binding protein [Curtobacterium sp. MMLR14_006]